MRRIILSLVFLVLTTFAAPVKTSIAVSDLEARGMTKDEGGIISDRLREELLNTGVFRVMERTVMDQILREQSFQQSGVCTGSDCQVQVGRMLGVDRLIIGSVGKLGTLYTLSIRMLNVETGEVEQSFSQDHQGAIEDLVRGPIRNVAAKLAWAISNKQEPRAAPNQEASLTVPETAPAPKSVTTAPTPPTTATQTSPPPATSSSSESYSILELAIRFNIGSISIKGDSVSQNLFGENELFFQFGGGFRVNFGALAFSPELLYSKRNMQGSESDGIDDFEYHLETSYLSSPLLLNYSFTPNFFMLAGPGLDFSLDQKFSMDINGETVPDSLYPLVGLEFLSEMKMKPIYASVIFGGGFRTKHFICDYRYQLPITDAYSASGETMTFIYDLKFRLSNWALSFGYLF